MIPVDDTYCPIHKPDEETSIYYELLTLHRNLPCSVTFNVKTLNKVRLKIVNVFCMKL